MDVIDVTNDMVTGTGDNQQGQNVVIDYTSTEEKLTLYAIKHDYCNHSLDISAYNSVADIKEEDGGTYMENVNPEDHQYHDPLQSINSILADYGVASTTDVHNVTIIGDPNEFEELKDWEEGEIQVAKKMKTETI